MVLTSDINVDVSKFSDSSITPEQHAFNAFLTETTVSGPRWYEVGAAKYRELRAAGKTPLPGRTVLEGGKNIQITSRDAGRDIPCRVFLPPNGAKPKATFMHVHGGGWVLQSHEDFDPLLKRLATEGELAVVSVGYRLAPEDPFPAGPNDCYDVVDWLAANAEHHFGAPLRFISGESAGGHLSVLSALHLLSLPQPYLGVKGLVLHFGAYDLSALPAWKNFKEDIVLPQDVMSKYIDVFVPQHKQDPGFLKRPEVSPMYADLKKFQGQLPAALFTCGTVDPLLDDTVFFGTKWMTTGAETYIKIFPGQPHGFLGMPKDKDPAGEEAIGYALEFIASKTT